MKKFLRSLPLVVVVLVVIGLLVYGFWPAPVPVEVAKATRGNLQVTVDEDGKTRIREKFTVSAPVSGKLFRIELEEGDAVVQGETVLARIEPGDPSLLDARAQAEAEARLRAAEATVDQAKATLNRAVEAYELAQHDYKRALELIETRTISMAEFDATEHQERMSQADVRSAQFAVAVANFQLEMAKAALIRTQPDSGGNDASATLTITSPINGKVLRVLQEDAVVVSPGAGLMEIGDPHDLEMVIDVLSTDAVKIRPGAKVIVEHWGGPGQLEGTVRLVEPSAFLKVSALGVEEQRVNVVADFTSPFEQRTTLGDEYRIEARIVVDEATDIVKVPEGTLLHHRGAPHVFRVVNGLASLQKVETGKSNGLETEIAGGGIEEGTRLILHPTDEIQDGIRVNAE